MANKNTNIKLNLIAEIKNGKEVGDLSLRYEDLSKAAEIAAKSLKK
ncbi:MAG: hypothetical protein J1E38_09270 [Paramuribaculum sp.]|nr:hypothetical protein [Paramuribaculum sp.]